MSDTKKRIWITRDAEGADDSDILFIHTEKPTKDSGGDFIPPSGEALAIPEVKPGKMTFLDLEFEE